MNYVGVDLHQKTSWFYVVDSCGNKLDSRNEKIGVWSQRAVAQIKSFNKSNCSQ